MNSDILLDVDDVARTYSVSKGLFRGRVPLRAVRGVSLTLQRGEVLGIVGESGCGKSTLARLLLGLEDTSSGRILLDGEPISSISRLRLTRRIQPVFQDPFSSLNPRKTVAALISLPLRAHKIGTPREQLRKVEEMVDLVGLPRRILDSPPNQLSGGQRQRVAIARALIMRPDIVVCDEPTSALDVSVQAQVLNLLQDLREQLNVTYVLISHNLAVVEYMAKRVAVMYLGRIVEENETAALFAEPRHPYTRMLLDSVLTADPDLGLPDAPIESSYPSPTAIPGGCSFHPRCVRAFAPCGTVPPSPLRLGVGSVECHLYADSVEQSAPSVRLPGETTVNDREGSLS
ncbi:MAG: ATP-binding cassette domain-containing protein [Salinarimonadaceae bacterium]|nr:MAG: ATP-binding cassette domain-containing protein [Salinarimonadaceae bacterium]